MNIDAHSDLSLFLQSFSNASSFEKLKIEERIGELYAEFGCVIMCDMCNFTLISQTEGIVFYLDLVRQMQSIVKKRADEYDSHFIKFFADNALLLFEDVTSGVECIKTIFHDLDVINLSRSNRSKIELCVGGCFGKILNFDQIDIFGASVNHASILGEDFASSRELLITQYAFERLSNEVQNEFNLIDTRIDKINTPVYLYIDHV